MRLIESKPKYEELFRDIYRALQWLICENSVLETIPRVPGIIYSRDDFLDAAYSFIVLQEPDRTFNNLENFANEDAWHEDCMEIFQDRQCFEFYRLGFSNKHDAVCTALEDMKTMLNLTRASGIGINAKHNRMMCCEKCCATIDSIGNEVHDP
jgi:hypothetical protein